MGKKPPIPALDIPPLVLHLHSIQSLSHHAHLKQDEFMYILKGRPTLQTDDGRFQLSPGMCVGFPAGKGNANNLINETAEDVFYLEIGDRTPGDEVIYPDDDIQASEVPMANKRIKPFVTAYLDAQKTRAIYAARNHP